MASQYPSIKDILTVMRLRKKGWTFDRIAEKMGKDHKRVFNLHAWGSGRKAFKDPRGAMAKFAMKVRLEVAEKVGEV